MWDTLTFSGPGANSGLMGTIQLNISGSFQTAGQGSACLLVGIGLCNPLFHTPLQTWPTLDSADPSEILTASFALNGLPVSISAGMYAQAKNPTVGTIIEPIADLYDPPTLSLQLPAGVTFTSASGVFLTSTVSGSPGNTGGGSGDTVPEPDSLPLLVMELAALFLVARRRDRRTAR